MRGNRSSRLPMVLLAAGLVLVLALAWQAWDAARSHRATVEGVLRDYAALAGGELVRRSSIALGYSNYIPVATALNQLVQSRGGVLPDRGELADALSAEQRPALDLVDWFFYRAPSGELSFSPPGPPARLEARVRAALRAAEGDRVLSYIHLPAPGRPGGVLTLVHAFPRESAAAGGRVGFAVNPGDYPNLFRLVLEHEHLLPPSLGEGGFHNGLLCLRVEAPDGSVVHRSGEGCGTSSTDPHRWAEAPFGDFYNGVLEGFTVWAAVDREAAPRLVPGGMPSRRLPGLAGLLLLTVGVVVVAALQLRRERQLARLRGDFVSRVSHELRTPLTQIRLFSETLLLDRARSDADRRRALQIIDKEARRLGHLVENVLQFSRSERGALDLAVEPVPLAPLVREVVEEMRPLVEGAGCRVECEAVQVTVPADPDAVHQMLLNLLDNAAKYGPPGQEIRVGVEAADGGRRARLWVEDEGPGVPEGEREAVFGRFYRLRREAARAVAGTGIGLAVVRDLAERQGGRVWVEAGTGARPERRGARFVIELPTVDETTDETMDDGEEP